MYLFWLFLALLMTILYWYLEWLIWRALAGNLLGNEASRPTYQRNFLVIAIAGVVFIGISSLYFSVLAFTKGDLPIFRCWLLPATLLSTLIGIGKARSLKALDENSE